MTWPPAPRPVQGPHLGDLVPVVAQVDELIVAVRAQGRVSRMQNCVGVTFPAGLLLTGLPPLLRERGRPASLQHQGQQAQGGWEMHGVPGVGQWGEGPQALGVQSWRRVAV